MTVLVECGDFSREVSFVDGGNDVSNLQNAIPTHFPGLMESHIALLQVESADYHGHFMDILDQNMEITSNSVIKVLLFSQVSFCH